MKRLHLHLGVSNLEQSITFYSNLFGSAPVKVKADYAKWMLDDPRINFAISTRATRGVDHLGIQVEEASELEALRAQLRSADTALLDEGTTTCCYARSDKSWVKDPDGVAWEAYQTMEDAELFSKKDESTSRACCG